MDVLVGLSVLGDLEVLGVGGVCLVVGDFLYLLGDVDWDLFGLDYLLESINHDGSVDKLLLVDDLVLEWSDDKGVAVLLEGEWDIDGFSLGLEDFSVDWAVDFLGDDLLVDDNLLSDDLVWYVDELLDESLDNDLSWDLDDLLDLNLVLNVVWNWAGDDLLDLDLLVDLVDLRYLLLDCNDLLSLV